MVKFLCESFLVSHEIRCKGRVPLRWIGTLSGGGKQIKDLHWYQCRCISSKHRKKGRELPLSGNVALESGLYEYDNEFKFSEERTCFDTIEEAVCFIDMLDYNDEFKVFEDIEIVIGLTVDG